MVVMWKWLVSCCKGTEYTTPILFVLCSFLISLHGLLFKKNDFYYSYIYIYTVYICW